MKILKWVVPGLLLIFSVTAQATPLYPFESSAQSEQFNYLLRHLRCLVCQNQDLADSNAGLANDLRAEVYRHVNAGESTDEIITYLTDRYGDFILFSPPVKSVTLLLWAGPFIFLLLGFLMFWVSTRHD